MFWKIRSKGVMGINSRNLSYIMPHNPRQAFPNADNKLITKRQAAEHGIGVPELYGVAELFKDIRYLDLIIGDHEQFVLKPAHGSGGDGVLVVTGRSDGSFTTARGRDFSLKDLQDHARRTLHGLYSLGGQADMLMVEYCVQLDPVFQRVSFGGIPDIRVICFMGVPVMAMLRLPTSSSGGRANLHQGAIGVGVTLDQGITKKGVSGSSIIDTHPDTQNQIYGIQIPGWDRILEMASGFHEFCGLGYVGVDIVIDRNLGPLVLEINARPGLAIQLANQVGLVSRLAKVDPIQAKSLATPKERVAFAKELFQEAP